MRFELTYYALAPDIKVIAPWREWDLTSRTRLLDYADQHQIPIARDKRGEAPFSVDANLLHISAEGKMLEDPWVEPEEYVFSRTVAPEQAPDQPQYVEIDFVRGDPVAVDGEALSPAALLTRLNEFGGRHGIGRLDLVENRFVGMKSRGVYETPGGTILQAAHRGIESLTLDRGAMHLKDELMPRYAELIYNGFWFAPEREMLQALVDRSQQKVDGRVRLKLYKGLARVVGRQSPNSLYSQAHVTFEEDQVYDQRDAEGFIRLQALRLRLAARRDRKERPSRLSLSPHAGRERDPRAQAWEGGAPVAQPRPLMRLEPAHHDAVEFVRALDIGEMPAAGDLLVARARHQARRGGGFRWPGSRRRRRRRRRAPAPAPRAGAARNRNRGSRRSSRDSRPGSCR